MVEELPADLIAEGRVKAMLECLLQKSKNTGALDMTDVWKSPGMDAFLHFFLLVPINL